LQTFFFKFSQKKEETMKEEKKKEEEKRIEPTFPQIMSEGGGIHKIYTKDKGMYIFISPGQASLEDLKEVSDFLCEVIKKSISERERVENEEFAKVTEEEKVEVKK
jgi:hypothetical protein